MVAYYLYYKLKKWVCKRSMGAVGVIAPMVFEKIHIDAQHLGAAGCAEIWILKQTAHSYFCNFAVPGICIHSFIGM